MRKSELRGRILMEIESLISQSCTTGKLNKRFQNLHKLLLKKHYNAADVSIDYHRKRVKMDLVMDDRDYNPRSLNIHLPTIPANFFFKDLCDFLKSCLDDDNKSLAFYAGLLRSYSKKDVTLMAV
ncbi:MAG: hypothetical protein ACR2MM_08910 [Flavobacteriaceae bacterium]